MRARSPLLAALPLLLLGLGLGLGLSAAPASATAGWLNTEVKRTLDASGPVVKVLLEISAQRDEERGQGEAAGEYTVLLPPQSTALVRAHRVQGKKEKEELQVTQLADGEYAVRTGAGAGEQVDMRVQAWLVDALVPFPAQIEQNDAQLVLLNDSHFTPSPYPSRSQTTVVRVGGGKLESFTEREPVLEKGSRLTFGPFRDVPPHSVSPMTVHFENNRPFAKMLNVQREIEVSHWGNIYVEELYELLHAGAELKNGFSRIEYQLRRRHDSPVFRSLSALLPMDAWNIYYRDQIGNISTSSVSRDDKGTHLNVETRFPIFGGWKTQFYVGYNVPTESMLKTNQAGNKFALEFDFFPSFQNIWVEDLSTKVILPEGATNIEVNLPHTVDEEYRTRRFTFLDTHAMGGRPVISFSKKNLVEAHGAAVTITYDFNKSNMFVEPALLVGFFLAFYAFIFISQFLFGSNGGGKGHAVATATAGRSHAHAD